MSLRAAWATSGVVGQFMLQSEIHFPQKGPHSDRLWPEKQVFHIEGNCERPQGEGRGCWQCPQSCWHSGRAGPGSHSQERLQINPELKGVSLRMCRREQPHMSTAGMAWMAWKKEGPK